jgi:hypothetical protein
MHRAFALFGWSRRTSSANANVQEQAIAQRINGQSREGCKNTTSLVVEFCAIIVRTWPLAPAVLVRSPAEMFDKQIENRAKKEGGNGYDRCGQTTSGTCEVRRPEPITGRKSGAGTASPLR